MEVLAKTFNESGRAQAKRRVVLGKGINRSATLAWHRKGTFYLGEKSIEGPGKSTQGNWLGRYPLAYNAF